MIAKDFCYDGAKRHCLSIWVVNRCMFHTLDRAGLTHTVVCYYLTTGCRNLHHCQEAVVFVSCIPTTTKMPCAGGPNQDGSLAKLEHIITRYSFLGFRLLFPPLSCISCCFLFSKFPSRFCTLKSYPKALAFIQLRHCGNRILPHNRLENY